MYVLVENGQVARYPYTVTDLRHARRDVSFGASLTDADLTAFGLFPVVDSVPPACDPITQEAVQVDPVLANGQWVQTWTVRDLTADEVTARKLAIQYQIVAAVQQRLDAFAQTRNYDDILSACTYATSSVPSFKSEGAYCAQARDATWAALYQILAEVQAGTRTAPTSYADIEAELPVLAWPT